LKACGEFLSLDVPGLAEGRPSLLIGDRVILCVAGERCNLNICYSRSDSRQDEKMFNSIWEKINYVIFFFAKNVLYYDTWVFFVRWFGQLTEVRRLHSRGVYRLSGKRRNVVTCAFRKCVLKCTSKDVCECFHFSGSEYRDIVEISRRFPRNL
jgi:hypothetical protein